MIMYEIQQDLFTVPHSYYLAHCISGDFALGKGIAKTFADNYNMRFKLHRQYPIPDGEKYGYVGKALLVDNVFNLVTKGRYYHKPEYSTLRETLIDMMAQCLALNVKKLAIPLLGCGLDRLDWSEVSEIIKKVFEDTDIEIMVCKL